MVQKVLDDMVGLVMLDAVKVMIRSKVDAAGRWTQVQR
jgi:hypothetical protein